MAEAISIAKDNLQRAQDRQSKYANNQRREETFVEGEEALLSTANFVTDSMKHRPSKKLTEKYVGPYKVVKMVSPVAAKLDLPSSMKIHPVFHIALLKKLTLRPNDWKQPDEVPPPPITIKDHEEYEVEKILDKRILKRGRGQSIQYFVLWKGYPMSDATWEPLSHLDHCKGLIEDYEASSSSQRGKM